VVWTTNGWRAETEAPCPGTTGQPADMHDMWGSGCCNPITHDDPEEG
jgi:hypothetical protein